MLDWEKFKSLSGLDANNFEKLCRSIVRRRFGRFGPLVERKNQPGVEYFIELNQDCSELGVIGDKVGWQCKWFDRRANGELTASSRAQVTHSLETTDRHVSDLVRWILWTPFTLAKVDQDWFYALKSKYNYQLELWNDEDIESSLIGEALELRRTYFGELALTPEALCKQHSISVAPIHDRWVKEVHQHLNVEVEVRQFLGEPYAWGEFESAGERLSRLAEVIEEIYDNPCYIEWADDLKEFIQACKENVKVAEYFNKNISAEDIDSIKSMLGDFNLSVGSRTFTVLRTLRKQNLPLALELTNALAIIKDIRKLLIDVVNSLSHSFVAVLADAGGGKTQLAAELTAPQDTRPAGILLHGRKLRRGDTLDDLVRDISFNGENVPNFSSLLAALDAAANRDNCRLPIVIDGLNESEDPREWKPLLETVLHNLKDYPNVLLICTLRTGERARRVPAYRKSGDNRETFAQMALPKDCLRLESEGFGELTKEAVQSYFCYYKIETDLMGIPEDFFSHPLNLRIFCEVTNRKREEIVRIERFPASITTLFHSQIDYAAIRISELPNMDYSYEDVSKAIYYLGLNLWESGQRYICEAKFLNSLNQHGRDWDKNIINLLAQEGIIFRNPGDEPYSYVITPIYDRLGGYIIANALLQKYTEDRLFNWTREQYCIEMLFGDKAQSHALAQDIIYALTSLIPQRSDVQFWMIVPEESKNYVLELSTLIDAENICSTTIEEYRQQLLSDKISVTTFFRLKGLRSSRAHPLNADFFNNLLSELSVAERDLSWTEFLRLHRDGVLSEIESLENRWKNDNISRTESDCLRARWMSWYLTSTCLDIRDKATRALYWYGRRSNRQLFEMTIGSLSINDPYISERLLAISYGVVMCYVRREGSLTDIEWLAEQLDAHMFNETADSPTTHLLARDYASKIIELGAMLLPSKFTYEQLTNVKHPFPSMPRRKWELVQEKSKVFGDGSPFRMDFENYTIGRLVSNRRNYDSENPTYKELLAKIRWRVRGLGWTSELFSEVDKEISADNGYRYNRANRTKVERYGKKYSWIAYYEVAGQLMDEEQLELWGSRFTVDIDPSFPAPIDEKVDNSVVFLNDSSIHTKDWITNLEEPNIDSIVQVDTLDDIPGNWVLLGGHVSEESKRLNRNFYVDIKGYLLNNSSLERLILAYENKEFERDLRPDLEDMIYLFAGEIYWRELANPEGEVKFEVVVGQKTEQKKQPIMDFTRDEDGSVKIKNIGEKTVTVQVPEFEYFSAYSPTTEYSWDSERSAMPSIRSLILVPKIVETLELHFDPVSFEYRETNGTLAAKGYESKGDADNNYRSMFYIREDLLKQYLKEQQLNLVLCSKGERRKVIQDPLREGDEEGVDYMNFDFYHTF
jgi:hypothetical protein